jgi:hypothetical protein
LCKDFLEGARIGLGGKARIFAANNAIEQMYATPNQYKGYLDDMTNAWKDNPSIKMIDP